MTNQPAIVGKIAPDFSLLCTSGRGSGCRQVTLNDYRGHWLILMFYPRDFSLVCPTELTAVSARFEEFQRRGCDVLGISTDSIESHQQWMDTPPAQGGVGYLTFPLGSDPDGAMSRAYGVYLEHEHVALRGLFIIDPNGVLQYQGVHNLSVGRRSDEILRTLAALQTGGMCPENWRPDSDTLDPCRLLGPGSVISHYRIEEKVGEGSFGCVFRAQDTVLQRIVALKVFKPRALTKPTAVLTEARAAAALNHPNVCTIFAVDDSEGVPIIAMAYLTGRPLDKMLEEGALSRERAAAVGSQIAMGMAAAHATGIVHGDLKPANIMLTDDGVAKITDFGLSRHLEHSSDETASWDSVESVIKITGTPSYMSPEQTRGERATRASDVFSLGVILYEMLTGRRAFSGNNVLEVLEQIRGVNPERFASEVAGPFALVLKEALACDSAKRLITMKQFNEMLEYPPAEKPSTHSESRSIVTEDLGWN